MLWASVRGSLGVFRRSASRVSGQRLRSQDALGTTPLGLGDKGRRRWVFLSAVWTTRAIGAGVSSGWQTATSSPRHSQSTQTTGSTDLLARTR